MSAEPAKPGEKPRLERWLEALLDPKTIHYLLGLGGALCVLGVVVWLASLGVFKDALVLGCSLIAGNCFVLAFGVLLAIRTGYRTAGNAVAFLACVLAPLNLWFLHAQNLITVTDHLWVGGVVCSLAFAAVVRLLREPMHVYAVEIGAALTVLLLLADVNRAADPVYLAVAGVALAAVSLQSIRGFPSEGNFARGRFFAPLFISGQVQLASGLMVLAASQLFGGWPILGRYGLQWLAGGFDQSPWLAAVVWSASAYLYVVSHRLTPSGRLFASAAIVCAIFAALSIVNPYLGVDGRIVAYAVCSVVFAVRSREESGVKSLRELAVAGSLTLGMLACSAVVLRANGLYWYAGMALGWPLFAAALVASISQLIAARFVQNDSRAAMSMQAILAGGTLTAVVVVARALWWPESTSLLSLGAALALPATVLSAAVFLVREDWKRVLSIASLTAITIGIGTGIGERGAFDAFVHPNTGNPRTLYLALLAAQVAFTTGLALAIRRHPVLVAACGLAVSATIWLGLGVIGVPTAFFGSIIAALGLIAVIAGQMAENQSAPRTALSGIGRGLITLAALASGFQSIPYAFNGGQWMDVCGFAIVAVICAAAGMMDADRDWRRAFRTFAVLCSIGVLLDINALVDLPTWRKAEFISAFLGLAIVSAGYVERLLNKEDITEVPGYMWFGAMLAAVPVLATAMYFRFDQGRPSLPEELATLTAAIFLSATGLAWRFKAPTIVGLGSLAIYLAVMIGQLAYHPQVAVGVYLAVGGGLLFAVAALLAAYRESLLALPEAIERRKGVFQVLDWR
jgi:hypothetical protein